MGLEDGRSGRFDFVYGYMGALCDEFCPSPQEHDDGGSPLQSRTGNDTNAGPVQAGRQQLRRRHLSRRPWNHQESVRSADVKKSL